jgi:hypothetical protein
MREMLLPENKKKLECMRSSDVKYWTDLGYQIICDRIAWRCSDCDYICIGKKSISGKDSGVNDGILLAANKGILDQALDFIEDLLSATSKARTLQEIIEDRSWTENCNPDCYDNQNDICFNIGEAIFDTCEIEDLYSYCPELREWLNGLDDRNICFSDKTRKALLCCIFEGWNDFNSEANAQTWCSQSKDLLTILLPSDWLPDIDFDYWKMGELCCTCILQGIYNQIKNVCFHEDYNNCY